MSSTQGTQDALPVSQENPPYSPRNAALGGTPEVIPDVPVASVLLVLYLLCGIIHILIFNNNKDRGHKFVFNGAILGLCILRIITLSLRIAWVYYPRNFNLDISADVFFYVGVLVLYMVNWFFVQRIVRAQHTRIGWSAPYRFFHRSALAGLLAALIMLVVASVCQFFAQKSEALQIYRALYLAGETYFAAFCLAPAVLILLSLIVPRTEIEKFGAGRLRINIVILMIAVAVLSIGQVFRCVVAWLPPTPLQNARGQLTDSPWYLSKACFYSFNFFTEIIVVIMFAIVRIDLRFHVPNGSRIAGDYSGRNSRYNIDAIESEKNLVSESLLMAHQNNSSETLHQYHASLFDDTRTLADSLRYASSTLEVDQKTGHWKVKRISTGSAGSRSSMQSSSVSRTSLADRSTLINSEAPPVPEIPAEWPLPASVPPRSSIPVMEHVNPSSRRTTPRGPFDIRGHPLNYGNAGDAVTDALTKLEQNSGKNKMKAPIPPPQLHYDCCRSPVEVYRPTLPFKNEKGYHSCPNCRTQSKRSTYPPNSAFNPTRPRSSTNRYYSERMNTEPVMEVPKIPQAYRPEATAALHSHPARLSSGSLEIISLMHAQNTVSSRVVDVSLQGEEASIVTSSENAALRSSSSSNYSDGTTSLDFATAQEENKRFSFEVEPVSMIRGTKGQRAS